MQTTGILQFRYNQNFNNSVSINIINEIGATARLDAAFGEGSGPTLLNNMRCTGLETRLLDCPNERLEIMCAHSRDAGVICTEGA